MKKLRMNFIYFMAAILCLLLTACGGSKTPEETEAPAEETASEEESTHILTVTIVNQTGGEIGAVYIAPAMDTDWGFNLIEGIMADGEEQEIFLGDFTEEKLAEGFYILVNDSTMREINNTDDAVPPVILKDGDYIVLKPAGSEEPYVITDSYQAEHYIDLHLHLDGAVTTEIAKQLAELQDITLPASDDAELKKLLTVPEDCTSLNEFLECFALPLSLMQTPEGLSEAVRLVADNIQSQGVIYAEIRFAPQLHTENGMTQEDAVLAALDGMSQTDLKMNLILCCMRGEDNDELNDETLRLAEKYLVEDGGVTAIDLAGAEALYPTENYRGLFKAAADAGVPFTIHAGEAAGPESVRCAVEYGASRIGHGVRIKGDPEVMALVKEKGVTLEMCPTSNRQTHAVEDMADYPLIDYMDQGIRVTLNTDDMGIEGTTLANEFRYMEREVQLTPEQKKILLGNAVDAAFTTDEVKAQLRTELGL